MTPDQVALIRQARLIAMLEDQLAQASQEINRLRNELVEARAEPKTNGKAPKGSTVPRVEKPA